MSSNFYTGPPFEENTLKGKFEVIFENNNGSLVTYDVFYNGTVDRFISITFKQAIRFTKYAPQVPYITSFSSTMPANLHPRERQSILIAYSDINVGQKQYGRMIIDTNGTFVLYPSYDPTQEFNAGNNVVEVLTDEFVFTYYIGDE